MPELFPTFEPPELVEESEEATPEYPPSWKFDFEKGDFLLDGAGRPVIADGHTAWIQWCIKAVLTQRYAYLAYDPEYCCDWEGLKDQPTRAAKESWIEREITEALMVDPRTEKVQDFAFEWVGDEVRVSFTVFPVVGSPERLEVTLSG